jgi:hypothetical protein
MYLKSAMDKYVAESVINRRSIGCIGNNDNASVELMKASHIVTSVEFIDGGKCVEIDIEILTTPEGKRLAESIEFFGKDSLQFSINGLGDVTKNGVRKMDIITSINAYSENL